MLFEQSSYGPIRKNSASVSVSTPRYSMTPVDMLHAASTEILGSTTALRSNDGLRARGDDGRDVAAIRSIGPSAKARSASTCDSYDLYCALGKPDICRCATSHDVYTPGTCPVHTTYHFGFFACAMVQSYGVTFTCTRYSSTTSPSERGLCMRRRIPHQFLE